MYAMRLARALQVVAKSLNSKAGIGMSAEALMSRIAPAKFPDRCRLSRHSRIR